MNGDATSSRASFAGIELIHRAWNGVSPGGETSADTRVGCTAPVRRLLRVSASTRTGTADGPDARRNCGSSERVVAAGTSSTPATISGTPNTTAAHHGLAAPIPIPQAISSPAARPRMILPARGVTTTPVR